MSIDLPRDAVQAIGLAVREMRVEMGEPSERTAISVEDTIKREYERWMVVEDEEPLGGGGASPARDRGGPPDLRLAPRPRGGA